MDVTFVAQPFADGRDLRDFLDEVAPDAAIDQLDVVVAWAKRSGLRRVRTQLEAVRDRPGTTRLIVGIDEGGATRQGLELAREIFTSVHVLHDNSWRTFHPKIFLGAGPDRARLLVGSNNLTAGGVFYNYEASLECVLSLPADQRLVDEVRAYIDRLYADADVCKPLDDALFHELVNNPRYRVQDEDASKTAAGGAANGDEPPEDVDREPDGPESAPELAFGKSAEPKRIGPLFARVGPREAAASKAAGPATAAAPVAGDGMVVRKRWFKKMSHSDAQQPKTAKSNIKGIVTLGSDRGRHPINPASYFRDVFFGDLTWTEAPVPRGEKHSATFDAEIVVNGASVGTYTLTVDHQTSRTSGQNNVPTWLHWERFGQYLRTHDHVDDWVTIERGSDGAFRVIIDSTATGPFIDT